MKCSECRGACCEQLILPIGPSRLAFEFLRARGKAVNRHGMKSVVLECACPKLTEDGQCSIYERRPRFCAEYKRGGTACIEAVRARRTEEEFQRIREVGDPLR